MDKKRATEMGMREKRQEEFVPETEKNNTADPTESRSDKMADTEAETLKVEPAIPGRIDTVRKVISAAGCALMLFSIFFPFLRMTEPNEVVTDMSRAETFSVGMPGWEAGPYIIWLLIAASCALILGFQLKNNRKRSRHGCRLALFILIFDALTIAGFVAQYGPSDISFFPLAGFWLLLAGDLLAWIASFLHKRKRKSKKNRRKKGKEAVGALKEDAGEDDETGEDRGAEEVSDFREKSASGNGGEENDLTGRKLYREAKKQQKLEREERMRKAATGRDGDKKEM